MPKAVSDWTPAFAGGTKVSPTAATACHPVKSKKLSIQLQTILICIETDVRLSELAANVPSIVREVESLGENDAIARRLRDLGFVAGEPLVIVASAPMGGDPLLVQIGFTRFALRRSEAARVRVDQLDV